MIKYIFSVNNPQRHLVDITAIFDNCNKNSSIVFQLPAWRPGRYELGNFAKNIQKLNIKDGENNKLIFSKISKDKWKVNTQNSNLIVFTYTYFANELNAGSTYCDETQLYVNPVNCCIYNELRINEPITVVINTPSHFQIASSLEKENEKEYTCKNFHELADSPFVASSKLIHHKFSTNNLKVNLWFCGEGRPNLTQITNDFTKFMNLQMQLFGSCPTNEYHYIIQLLPYIFYHGVEHLNSTVLALGPGYAINDTRFNDLLGVACHEFYHVWNIKSIRPIEMFPYNYSNENYFETGFVAEGVTTYMGDLILWQSNVFTIQQFFNEIDIHLQKHADNFGKFNHSLTQSGFDTWLDGYVPGIPNRKVSIYTEGCLLAMATDILIIKYTNGKKRLHDVMQSLFQNYKNKGYSYNDYVNAVSNISGKDFNDFFNQYAKNTCDLIPLLNQTLNIVGVTIDVNPSLNFSEANYGFKLIEAIEKSIITAIHPDSPAYEKLVVNDQIIAVNSFQVKNDANRWINYFNNECLVLTIIRDSIVRQIEIAPGNKIYYKNYHLQLNVDANQEQINYFDFWQLKN